jgi:hypothetical protein
MVSALKELLGGWWADRLSATEAREKVMRL